MDAQKFWVLSNLLKYGVYITLCFFQIFHGGSFFLKLHSEPNYFFSLFIFIASVLSDT